MLQSKIFYSPQTDIKELWCVLTRILIAQENVDNNYVSLADDWFIVCENPDVWPGQAGQAGATLVNEPEF